MAKHFQHVMALETPNTDELKAQFWLSELPWHEPPALELDPSGIQAIAKADILI